MSDFLSNFSQDNYKKTVKKKTKVKKSADKPKESSEPTEKKKVRKKRSKRSHSADESETVKDEDKPESDELPHSEKETSHSEPFSDEENYLPYYDEDEYPYNLIDDELSEEENSSKAPSVIEEELSPIEETVDDVSAETDEREEVTETDPSYKKRKRNKLIITAIISVIALIILLFSYYRFTTIKAPDFTGKPVSEVREWTTDNRIKADINQEYNFDVEANSVIKQEAKKGKRVKKKDKFVVWTSLGPDPDELVKLPDFSTMERVAAEQWVGDNKAENVTITTEFSDKVEEEKFIRQEFSNKEITGETYKRKDQLIVVYSKGKEVFEKNISVPNFVKKLKNEVEEWAKKNEINVTYEESDSNTIELGSVISQSIAENQKMAKKETITVTISKGKAIIVPNFADYNKTTAGEYQGVSVRVVEAFSDTIPFGKLISQSVAAGTKMYGEESAGAVTVTYSSGKPYLRSYMGTAEGDLAEMFFNDYQAKGANVTYTTYYVSSDQPKGSVVKMSVYNEFIPITYNVSIGISDGSRATEIPAASNNSTKSSDIPASKDSNDLSE